MRILKRVVIIIGAIVLVIVLLILKTFRDAGEFKEIVPHFAGQCETISGVLSSEDITIHPQTGIAFISSDDRRPWFQGKQGRQGAIFSFDLASDQPGLVNLTGDFDEEFHPHGIGLFLGQKGDASLFVVNHRKEGHFIEIFDYEHNRLIHRKSIRGDLMHSPNDVIPVGPESFYVTNDHGSESEFGRTLEDYLQLPRSYVLYYNGESFNIVAKDLTYANGINISRDGKTIYVAATVARKVFVYDRDMASHALKLRHEIDLGTGVDNIEVDEEGNLWIGAHPKLLTFVKHSKDSNVPSPSQILRVTVESTGEHKVDEIYLSDGDDLSGSSVAAVFQDIMLIGSVFDERFLRCKVR
jgi:arylesterase/paraoxonase